MVVVHDMKSQAIVANGGVFSGGDSVSCATTLKLINGENGLSQVRDDKGEGNLADEVLEGLEEYWEDINDRLIISRMVSDSVIKGMVTAVEQEAAEKITSQELQVVNLMECIQSHKVGGGSYGAVHGFGDCGRFSGFQRPCVKNEKMREELHALRKLAMNQFKDAKEILFARTSNSLRKFGSGSELVGLGGVLKEKQQEGLLHVAEILENLEKTMDTVCTKMDDVLLSSDVSPCEAQQEQDLLAKLEGVVIKTALRRYKKDFEEIFWEQNAQLCGIQNVNWLEKFNAIRGLGTQLDACLKSLSIHDTGLVYQGAHNLDHLHHKAFTNHITLPASLFGENGKLDASNVHIAESYDFQQLKHLSKEELVDYFNNIISKMKRDHESAVQEMTEEYFRLKRENLKERQSLVTHRKDDEFDVLRKKIPEVVSKLEDFLLENENFPALASSAGSIQKMEHRLMGLISENQQLRDCLTEKNNEVKCLKANAANTTAQQLRHSLSEQSMLKHVENLKSAMEDSHVETSLSEEVYTCALREQIAQIMCIHEDSRMEFLVTREIYDIILREAVIPAEMADKYENEDSDIESLITEGFIGLIFAEAIKEAEQEFNTIDKEILICPEAKALGQENELRLLVEENEHLRQLICDMETLMEQKEKVATDLSFSISKEREQFELVSHQSQELHSLREYVSQQQTLVAKRNMELQMLRSEHSKALEQIQTDKMELDKLDQMLDRTKEQLTEANKQRDTALAYTNEMHEKLVSSEVREENLKKGVEITVLGLSKMFDGFECEVLGTIRQNSLRLEDTTSHLKALKGMANVLSRTRLMYEQKLERKCSDLQMAEAEVDLLGDEVDDLLGLVQKVYVALDHYSPVLKHYPGIIEILKLVRRELSDESTKRS